MKGEIVDPQNAHTDIEYDLIIKKIGISEEKVLVNNKIPPKLVIYNLKFIEPSGNSDG